MTFEEAKRIIANDRAAFQDWVLATAVISSSSDAKPEDLIECLKRKGLPAEMASTALYSRTKRQPPDSIEGLVMDAENWVDYLKKKTE